MLSSADIAKKVAILLNDAGHTRWTISEVATWINAGCLELVMLKPTALTINVAMKLSAGSKQALAGATFLDTESGAAATITPIQLLGVVRNLGTDGLNTSVGAAIVGIKRKTLDVALPLWHTMTGAAVKNFMFDAKNPKIFYIYPGAKAGSTLHIEVCVSRQPVNVLAKDATEFGTDDIDAGLDDGYEAPLVDYVLYRAFAKDIEDAGNAQRSQWHFQAFQQALGVKVRNEAVLAPEKQFEQQAAPIGGGQA